MRKAQPVETLRGLLALRRQIEQSKVDTKALFQAARCRADNVRVAHFVGKLLAFQLILDMISIEVDSFDRD
ncbi:hypothetical protein [Fodinicola acaciae]|uniref:hypothetical protein n=1 Tax=Fodinicola acaciae TaxID=2681555 RepID=UPI0013D469FF|nr:hypothetical protein [Fodinicola acaciae]